MLADRLDALDASLNQPYGCLWVAISSLVFAGILWKIDRRVFVKKSEPSKARAQRGVRAYGATWLSQVIFPGCSAVGGYIRGSSSVFKIASLLSHSS